MIFSQRLVRAPAAAPVCAPALRRAPCGCYKSRMGTHGLRNRAEDCTRAADRPHGVSLALIAACLVALPALVGCSGSSSSSFGGPGPAQQAAMPPPPTAAAVEPGSAAAPGPATAAVAQPPSAPAAAQAPANHVDFLSMFRDPPSQTTAGPAPAAATGAYPSQSLVDLFKSDSAPNSAAAPNSTSAANSAAPARNANMPHPPSTYTPSGQPYTPPPGQPGYGQPAAAAPAAAPQPANSDQASVGGAYPQQSIVDIMTKDSGAQ